MARPVGADEPIVRAERGWMHRVSHNGRQRRVVDAVDPGDENLRIDYAVEVDSGDDPSLRMPLPTVDRNAALSGAHAKFGGSKRFQGRSGSPGGIFGEQGVIA